MIVKGAVAAEPARDNKQIAKRCAGCCVVFIVCITVVVVAIVVVRELAGATAGEDNDISRGDGESIYHNGRW